MKKQQLPKKSLNPLGLGGGSARKKSSSSLRKVPSWHRQMPANGGSLSRLVRTECANVTDKSHRYFPHKIQNSRTNGIALYGARRNDDDDDDDDSTDGVERGHNMSKSQSDTSMGTTSSWAGLNAPWDDDQEMPAPNKLWESNGFKIQTTSSTLLTISLPLPTREITTAPIVVEKQATVSTSNTIARNTSEMSLGDPLDVLTERQKATAVNHFSNQNMSNVGWGSASLSRVFTTPMEATPASML